MHRHPAAGHAVAAQGSRIPDAWRRGTRLKEFTSVATPAGSRFPCDRKASRMIRTSMHFHSTLVTSTTTMNEQQIFSDRHRQQWESLGTDDPYWAVLSHPAKQHGGWDKQEFFQTGVDEIKSVLAKASSAGIKHGFGVALDYGCGVGRLSRALSASFKRVVGVDISEAMLTEARSANAKFDNIQFIHNSGDTLPGIDNDSIDFIYSNIVLQHSPRANQRLVIKEFCRALRPGGALVFQTPSHQNLMTIKGLLHFLLGNRILNLARTIKYGKTRVMEMHTFGKNDVLELLRKEGVSVVKVDRYDSAGQAFVGYLYFATKA
jgi:ubiquinone/menaquinone biosynthesis C-methylase UbiE